MKRIITIISLVLIFATTGGYATERPIPEDLKKLVGVSIKPLKESEEKEGMVSAMRPNAIKEAAYTLGMQNGVQWYYRKITSLLDRVDADLDQVFDFRGIMYPELVTPAIILKADNSYIVKNDVTAIRAKATYKIHKPAKIVSRPPDWRDYLWHDFSAISEVNEILYPKDDEELILWQTSVINGWNDGIHHAIRTFESNINELVRDYLGMSRAHILAANKMIEEPVIASCRNAVHSGKNSIDIDQKIIRITTKTKFTDKKNWKPSVDGR